MGGIYLGRGEFTKTGELGEVVLTGQLGNPVIYTDDRHLLLFGPTGSGKSRRILTPNLLGDWLKDRSIIVVDPKGDLAKHTVAEQRRQKRNVVFLNPFNLWGLGSTGFNPLAALDPGSDDFYDDAAGIAEALIAVPQQEPHWAESARGLITGLIMWEVFTARKGETERVPSLENVRLMLTEPDEFEEYTETKDGKEVERKRQVKGLGLRASYICKAGDDAMASLVSRFAADGKSGDRKEIESIRSTADTQTRWLLSKPIAEDLARPDGIDFRTLKQRPTTVYVTLPPKRVRTHSVWLRLVIESALRALYVEGGLKTVLFIDEAATLGRFEPLEEAYGLVRGYGVQIMAIFQDMAQGQAIYGDRWESFCANAGVQQFFCPNDLTTADWMVKRLGERVARFETKSTTMGPGGRTTSTNEQTMVIPQIHAYTLFGMAGGKGILWRSGVSGQTHFDAADYEDMPDMKARAKP